MRTWSEANHLRDEWEVQWQSIHFDVMQPRPMGAWLYDYNSKCQQCSYDLVRHLTQEAVTGSGAIWDAWATLNGYDPEIGYIHNPTGTPPSNRKVFTTGSGGSVWVANMGEPIWREWKVAEVIKIMKQQEYPYTWHGEGTGNCPYDPFPLFIYDLAFYVLEYDTGFYNIATCAEYFDIPLDFVNPYVLGYYDFVVELQAALALDPIVSHVKIIPNYGHVSGLFYDPIVIAQLGIVKHAQCQVFGTSETLDKGQFDYNLVRMNLATTNYGITVYSTYIDLDDIDGWPTITGRKIANALFQLLQNGDLVPARYRTSDTSFPPDDLGVYRKSVDWEYNAMFRAGYLGDPTGAIQYSGPANRLMSREFENGIVYLWLKADALDASDAIEITVPAGAKELDHNAELIDIAAGQYEMNCNEGITIITNPPVMNFTNYISGGDEEEWPLVEPSGTSHVDVVKAGVDSANDSTYIESGDPDKTDGFTFSYPSNIGKLCEYKTRIRFEGGTNEDGPAIRAILWAGGDAWKVTEVVLPDGWSEAEIPFRSLGLLQKVMSQGGKVSIISMTDDMIWGSDSPDSIDPF